LGHGDLKFDDKIICFNGMSYNRLVAFILSTNFIITQTTAKEQRTAKFTPAEFADFRRILLKHEGKKKLIFLPLGLGKRKLISDILSQI
jgi:hypothetical protein